MSYEFRFPDIGEGLTEGKILEFKVEPGAEVVAGDILAIVETDKVVAEIASPRSGVVVRFGSAVGDRIGVGETLAFIDLADGAGEDDGSAAAPNGGHEFQALVGTLDAAPSIAAGERRDSCSPRRSMPGAVAPAAGRRRSARRRLAAGLAPCRPTRIDPAPPIRWSRRLHGAWPATWAWT